jgi:hypothetical protein
MYASARDSVSDKPEWALAIRAGFAVQTFHIKAREDFAESAKQDFESK